MDELELLADTREETDCFFTKDAFFAMDFHIVVVVVSSSRQIICVVLLHLLGVVGGFVDDDDLLAGDVDVW